MHSCIHREYCQISALSADSLEMFVGCNFISYFLLILRSVCTTLWNKSSLWNLQTCVLVYTADRADRLHGSLLISTVRTVSLLFSVCLSSLAVAAFAFWFSFLPPRKDIKHVLAVWYKISLRDWLLSKYI